MNDPNRIAPGASAAKTCGILGIVFGITCVGLPVGIVLGIVALVKQSSAKTAARIHPDLYDMPSSTGLITGIIALVLPVLLLPFIGIVSAIAIPALLGQRNRARDRVAISTMTTQVRELVGVYEELAYRQEPLPSIEKALDAHLLEAGKTQKNPWNQQSPAFSYTITYVNGLDEEGVRATAEQNASEKGKAAFVVQFPDPASSIPSPGYLAGSVRTQMPVTSVRTNKPRPGTTPLQVAENLHAHTDRALAAYPKLLPSAARDPELRRTLEDLRAMAHLGKYYAHKIRAATELALFRATLARPHHETVARELNQAAYHWRCYVTTATTLYQNPLWTNRVGHVDWRRTYPSVLYDLTIAGAAVDVPSMSPTPGGTIQEAEDAAPGGGADLPLRTASAGFTGRGYRDFDHTQDPRHVTFTFHAPAAGTYLLEFRYAMRRGETSPAILRVNGTTSELPLWPTGGQKTWAHDRRIVTLHAGANRITLTPSAVVSLDHLNILPWPQ